MFRRHRNRPGSGPDSSGSNESSLCAAVSDSAWSAGDRLRLGLKSLASAVRWPFERLVWALQRGVLWPLQDRFLHTDGPARNLGFAIVIVLAAGVGVAALVWAAPDRPGSGAKQAASSAPLADAPVPAMTPAPATGTLHGAAPSFKPAPAGGSSKVDAAEPIEAAPKQDQGSTAAAAATDRISSSPSSTSSSSAAQASAAQGAPAGPAAIAVAREFAGAFVRYETGDDDATVRKAFGTTATPQLSRSLLRRPPRLPANVKVPRAKVVNVVAGPSQGGVYTVSVALLRVGLTSELRLDMEQLKGERWRVTNVLG